MPWTESASESFTCRHASARSADAARVLGLLERTRERLAEHFPQQAGTRAGELTVVLHDSPHALVLSNPLMPVVWGLTAPRARRYVTGWAGRHELHVLSPRALRERASRVSGSYEMLALAPATLYARHLVVGSNRELQSARLPARSWAELRWAWLVEGAARWLSGESLHARAVVGQYLRYGHRPHFPPGARDAPLLAPTLIELLAEREGPGSVVRLVGRLHTGGAGGAAQRLSGTGPLGHRERLALAPAAAGRGWIIAPWPTTVTSSTASASCSCSSRTSSRSACSAASPS